MATSVCVCLFSELAKSSDVVSNWVLQERLRLNRKSTRYGACLYDSLTARL